MNENVNEARIPVGGMGLLRLPTLGCSGFLWEPCGTSDGVKVTRCTKADGDGADTCAGFVEEGGDGDERFCVTASKRGTLTFAMRQVRPWLPGDTSRRQIDFKVQGF